MSLLKTIKAQLGLSGTPANNFVLDASADNGTMKLARGNAGATTQDIMTVAANGGVSIKGGTVAPAPGMIGEILTASTPAVEIGVSGAVGNMGNITLTPGVWDVQVIGTFTPSVGITLAQVTGSLVAGALGAVSNAILGVSIIGGIGTRLIGEMARIVVNVNTVVICTVRASGASGGCQCSSVITARRVA